MLLQAKLLDFNPIFGTTSPLLFTWEELGYAAQNSMSSGGIATHVTTLRGSPLEDDQEQSKGLQDKSNESPDYRADRGREGTGSQATGSNSIGREGLQLTRTDSGECNRPQALGNCLSHVPQADPEFRIVLESNKVQPSMPLYGVPFDLIDNSDSSPYSDLIETLKQRHISESQADIG